MKGLTLNQREQARLQVLNQVLMGACSVVQAASILGLSERQVWRLLKRYRADGAAALVHGNRGRSPAHTLPTGAKQQVQALAAGPYAGVNQTHFTELLAEREGLHLSRSTVRRSLLAAGVRSPRTRRAPRHRSRRDRYPQEGMLLQIDGSRHEWLEDRGPRLTLLGAIDDATGTVPAAVFRDQEDAHGYFLLLRAILTTKGIPVAFYSDRHGIFQRSPRDPDSLVDQLAGRHQPTQFGRALQTLGIERIDAQSPQAKGRIERLWGTFQDRLVSELRLAGARTPEDATAVLAAFLPRFNARFGVPAAEAGHAYRAVPPDLDLAGVLAFHYARTVAADNTVRFFGQRLQLLPGPDRVSYVRSRVTVQERMDGSLVVVCQGQVLASQRAPDEPETLRARSRTSATTEVLHSAPLSADATLGEVGSPPTRPAKPAANHPWRRRDPLTFSLNR
jgi:transposase